MIRILPVVLLPLVLSVALLACSDSPTGPSQEETVEGLVWSLTLERDTVGGGEEFTAEVTLQNTRSDPVSIASTCSGLGHVHFRIYRDEEEMGAWGGGCHHVVGNIFVGPGETWEYEADLRAVRLPGGEPLEPGEYIVYAHARFGGNLLPVLGRFITVTEAVVDEEEEEDEPSEGSD